MVQVTYVAQNIPIYFDSFFTSHIWQNIVPYILIVSSSHIYGRIYTRFLVPKKLTSPPPVLTKQCGVVPGMVDR